MEVYTIKDLEGFEKDEYGRLICPTGDYTQISSFDKQCIFSERCVFSEWCVFNERCSFGDHCSFGDRCIFAEQCIFGMWCIFGELCAFDDWCSFGKWCRFEKLCVFGKWCSFSELCSFGDRCVFGDQCIFNERCIFGEGCAFEGIKEEVDRILKIDRIGSRKGCTYFYKTLSEIYVRCGCFFGTIKEFEKQVKAVHADNKQYLTEYVEAIRYARIVLKGEQYKEKDILCG